MEHLVHLGSVHMKLGVAVGHSVDGLVFLEAIALETEALGELLDLSDQDETDVLVAQVPFALGAVDGAIVRALYKLEVELALALRALENFGKHLCTSVEIVALLPRPGGRNSKLDGPVRRRVAFPARHLLGDRSMVGQAALNRSIGVRLPVSKPY